MSPRFQPDLTQARASFPVHPRGDYEVKVTGVKGIGYVREKDGKEVAGGRVNLEVIGLVTGDGQLDRELEGEPCTAARLYVHNEESWNFTKRCMMALLGYTLEQEAEFDEEVAATLDLSVDFDDDDDAGGVTLGEGWERLSGKHMLVTLGKEKFEKREQQSIGGFLPVGS